MPEPTTSHDSRQAIVIEKRYESEVALDYQFLFHKGISLIQQFSGRTWTDYNLHDPGITILETLCFAITDLAYRADQPLRDLLGKSDGWIDAAKNSFIPLRTALAADPVTPQDFRKLILDRVPGVANVGFTPLRSVFSSAHVKGIYKVVVLADLPHNLSDDEIASREHEIAAAIYELLQEHRIISERFLYPVMLKPFLVAVRATVQTDTHQSPEQLLAGVYEAVEAHLIPVVHYSTEQELRSRKFPTDDIFQGPALRHGFITDDSLPEFPTELDPAALVQVITVVSGVSGVLSLSVEAAGMNTDRAVIPIPAGHYPRLEISVENPAILLYAENHPLPIRTPAFARLLARQHEQRSRRSILANPAIPDRQSPKSKDRRYQSLQRLLPPIYGTRDESPDLLPDPASRAKIRQLKAYLLFFEQLLSNYQAQLQGLDELYAPVETGGAHRTYAVGDLNDVPGIRYLLNALDTVPGNETSWQAQSEAYLEELGNNVESDARYVMRKPRLLQHILSRFNLDPDSYPVLVYDSVYRLDKDQGRNTTEIQWLSALVSNLSSFTASRMQSDGFPPDGAPLRGVARNLALLLHLPLTRNAWLSEVPRKLMPPADAQDTEDPAEAPTLRRIDVAGKQLAVEYTSHPGTRSAFRFTGQGYRFFRTGMDPANFQIVEDPDLPDTQLVLFQNPGEQVWQLVRRYESRPLAAQGIQQWTRALIANNIAAEGFHLLEHCLLAPDPRTAVFGFRLQDEKGRSLLRQKKRTDFESRETALLQLRQLLMTDASEAASVRTITERCELMVMDDEASGFRDISDLVEDHPGLWNIARDCADAIRRADETAIGPKYVFDVEIADGAVVDELFFSAAVSVVLPAWPARFQERGFREFAERCFRNNLPAHVQVRVHWLGVAALREFETLFNAWQTAARSAAESDLQQSGPELCQLVIRLNQKSYA